MPHTVSNNLKTVVTAIVFSLIGFSINYYYEFEMNEDVWFWFFSTIAQVFAALIALVAVFFISRLDLYNEKINNNIQMIRSSYPYDFSIVAHNNDESLISKVDDIIKKLEESSEEKKKLYKLTAYRGNISRLKEKKKNANKHMKIVLRFTIPIIMLSIFLLPLGSLSSNKDIWLWDSTLKWCFIYLIVGLCISSLFNFTFALKDLLDEKYE